MVHAPPQSPADWLVQVPLSQLVGLQNMASELAILREENKQLRSRMDGLHRTQYDLMETILELRKSVSVPTGRRA